MALTYHCTLSAQKSALACATTDRHQPTTHTALFLVEYGQTSNLNVGFSLEDRNYVVLVLASYLEEIIAPYYHRRGLPEQRRGGIILLVE